MTSAPTCTRFSPRRLMVRWLAGVLCAASGFAAGQEVQPLPVSEVAPGVYVQFGLQQEWQPSNAGNVSNAAFVVGNRCVAVIDTGGSPEVGRRLRAAVQRTTPLPVCFAINTHSHPDHVLGNAAFAEAGGERPVFVAHARLPAALGARERHYRSAFERDFGQTLAGDAVVYPTRLVDASAAEVTQLDLGGRSLQLQAWPTAHTDHDLTVYDPATRTLFLGDLLFVGHLPVVDGSLRGWLAVMQRLRALDVAVAVPGHGAASTAWPGAMDPQERYLGMLLSETRAAIKRKLTIQQAVDQIGHEAASAWLLSGLFHRRNVTAAYAELEWEE